MNLQSIGCSSINNLPINGFIANDPRVKRLTRRKAFTPSLYIHRREYNLLATIFRVRQIRRRAKARFVPEMDSVQACGLELCSFRLCHDPHVPKRYSIYHRELEYISF